MSKARYVLVSILFVAVIMLAWRMNFPLFGAHADEGGGQRVEYKVLATSEVGFPAGWGATGSFQSSATEQKLNELAAQGWEWKEYVPAEKASFVIFVRRK